MPDQPVSGEEPTLLTVGRVNFDLFAADAGVSIADATNYVASVGGSPANIAIIARRLGVPSAILSATGPDLTGRFVRSHLQSEGVDTRWLQEIAGGATSLALLATLSPDDGDRQFYRSAPADALVNSTVIDDLPWGSLEAVQISADALASGPMAETAALVATTAAKRGLAVWWDLDLRPNSWPDPSRYHQVVAPAIAADSIVIGTEEEFAALMGLADFDQTAFESFLSQQHLATVVLKRGERGAQLYRDGVCQFEVPTHVTNLVCTVGAGDSMAGSLIAARTAGQEWSEALALASEAAAWTIAQPYCSSGFPSLEDLGRSALSQDRQLQ